MKIKRYLAAAAVGLALSGCQTRPADPDDAGQSGRTQYLATVHDQMNAVDKKIDDLADKSKGLKDDAKAQADKALAGLREERAILGEKYDQLMKSSQDAWESAKAGFANAWDQMQAGLNSAGSKFN